MATRLYVQLGKLGDILNILPVLHREFKHGNKCSLMVSKRYAGVLDGVSYVNKVVFEGGWEELEKGVLEAKKLSPDVVVTQLCGPPEEVKKYAYLPAKLEKRATDCWQKDSWNFAGYWPQWRENLPLVFDQRDPGREKALKETVITGSRKPILISFSAETAPFPHFEMLEYLVKLKFRRSNELINISRLRGVKFYDLLGLFDVARCLVTDDSSILHLAHACKRLPVCALINDAPSLWDGSAWRPNHIFHCRYSDFPRRCVEMLQAIDDLTWPGDRFLAKPERKLIHAWSQYEVNVANSERARNARLSWGAHYKTGNWVSCQIPFGAFGRDSHVSPIKDPARYPFVKDIFQAACMMGGDDDIVVLTRPDVRFFADVDLTSGPVYSRRWVSGKVLTYDPSCDLFAFSKAWWNKHRGDYPDMVMGPDKLWGRVLMEMMKMNGGKEVRGVYRDN